MQLAGFDGITRMQQQGVMKMEIDCEIHHGPSNLSAREPYDSIMRNLPRNQSGEGLARHACAICAYERGLLDMRKQIANWLDVPLDEVLPGS